MDWGNPSVTGRLWRDQSTSKRLQRITMPCMNRADHSCPHNLLFSGITGLLSALGYCLSNSCPHYVGLVLFGAFTNPSPSGGSAWKTDSGFTGHPRSFPDPSQTYQACHGDRSCPQMAFALVTARHMILILALGHGFCIPRRKPECTLHFTMMEVAAITHCCAWCEKQLRPKAVF